MSATEARFWAKVDKSGECWNWTGLISPEGYARFSTTLAHRTAYEMTAGTIPAGMCIDHICRNRKCVRPEHLRLATYKQNQENKSQAGRRDSRSGFRGVMWDSRRSLWFTRVRHEGRSYYAGTFSNVEDAKAAVIAKRNELYTYNDADRR